MPFLQLILYSFASLFIHLRILANTPEGFYFSYFNLCLFLQIYPILINQAFLIFYFIGRYWLVNADIMKGKLILMQESLG